MRKLILFTFLAIATSFAQQNDATKQDGKKGKAAASTAKVLTVAEFDNLLASPDKVLVIDVRRPDEVSANGGFPVYLSIQAADLEKHLAEIPKDRLIVTVSNHAARGGKAADLLASKGFKVAGTIGAETYAADGGKLAVKIAVPPPADKK
jgi:rhodanese-related sulfurtransferase